MAHVHSQKVHTESHVVYLMVPQRPCWHTHTVHKRGTQTGVHSIRTLFSHCASILFPPWLLPPLATDGHRRGHTHTGNECTGIQAAHSQCTQYAGSAHTDSTQGGTHAVSGHTVASAHLAVARRILVILPSRQVSRQEVADTHMCVYHNDATALYVCVQASKQGT